MGQSHRVNLIEYLSESLSRLPIHIHIIVYTLSFFIPGILSILIAVIQVQELDEGSGKLSELQLASVNLERTHSSTREILILSDLIYASSETYLIDGAMSLAKSTLMSYQGIDFGGHVNQSDIQQYADELKKLVQSLTEFSTRDPFESANQEGVFLEAHDLNSEHLLGALFTLNGSTRTALERMTVQVEQDRSNFTSFGALVILFWAFYIYIIFRIHLNYLALPVQFLDRATQAAIKENKLLELPEYGPSEYRSLSHSFRVYDQQLEGRIQILKIISEISSSLVLLDKVIDSRDAVLENLRLGFDARQVVWYERKAGQGFETVSSLPGRHRGFILPAIISEDSQWLMRLAIETGFIVEPSQDIALTDLLGPEITADFPVPAIGMIGIKIAGDLESIIVIVEPQKLVETIFNAQSLTQIGSVISSSLEKVILGEELEQRVRVRTEDLEKEKLKAEAANIAKSSFLSTMSHEIRTPFNAMIGMADMLLHSELDEQQTIFVKTILNSSRQLLELLSDVVDFSKLEAGGIDLKVDRFNVLSFLSDLVSVAALKSENEDQQVLLDLDCGPDLWLEGDEDMLRDVLLGLIGNAIQHSNAARIVLKIRTSAAKAKNKNKIKKITVAIIDDGIGISEIMLEDLINPFVQGGRKVHKGTGLGLAIVSRRVSMLGGQLRIESTQGEGSEFGFEIVLPEVESMTREIERLTEFMDSREYKIEQACFLDDGSMHPSIMQLVQYLNFECEVIGDFNQNLGQLVRDKNPKFLFVNLAMNEDRIGATLDLLRDLTDSEALAGSDIIKIGVGIDRSTFENSFSDFNFLDGFLRTPVYAKELLSEIMNQQTN